MKYKFYDNPPELNINDPAEWADRKLYTKELNWIAKNMSLDVNKFRVDDETFGDPVLFYGDKYMGYFDYLFYMAFGTDDFESWWGFYN